MEDKTNRNHQRQAGMQKQHSHGNQQKWGNRQDNRPRPQRAEVAGFPGEIHAPYNFVPLSKCILHPEWQAVATQDLPFEDGLSGDITLEIQAHSPILVGREKAGNLSVQFHVLPDGRYAIPGSSLRGMIRGVLEIASFSRMGMVDDQWFSVRDLTPGAKSLYGREFTKEDPKQPRTFEARSKSGWLKFENGAWLIRPCQHARIELSDLNQVLPVKWAEDILAVRNLDARKKRGEQLDQDTFRELTRLKKAIRKSAGEKYAQFIQRHGTGSLVVNFTPCKKEPRNHSNGNRLVYSRALEIGKGATSGCLVFTGQPGPNKHMEFIFHSTETETKGIPSKVFRAFLHIHKETDEWTWLNRNANLFPHGLPVFYLEEQGDIKAMGLAQMFKLAYTHSVHEVIAHTEAHHIKGDQQLDFVETLFGFVSGQQASMKGRVSFSDAPCSNPAQPMSVISTILNSPKPTYYPNYVAQKRTDASGNLPTYIDKRGQTKPSAPYSTFMDKDSEIRGWKRYPARPPEMVKHQEPTPEQARNARIQTQLQPLPAGTQFMGKLRFHNLLPEELGALIWSLTWGGNPALRHAIGMGKPFGYGQLSIRLAPASVNILPNKPDAPVPSVDALQQCFVQWVTARHAQTRQATTWQDSPQIRNLLAMANPTMAESRTLSHMALGDRNNHFVIAKNEGKVLQPYLGVHAPSGGLSADQADNRRANVHNE